MVSSPQRRRYLAARRRGLSQTEARKEVGVSRSSAWRYDQLFNLEVAQRTAALEAFNARRDARRAAEGDDDVWSGVSSDVPTPQGPKMEESAVVPMPPWVDNAKGPSRTAAEPLPEDDSYPAGLLERRKRAQSAGTPSLPRQHPMTNPRAMTMLHGPMPESENMSGMMSRPWLPEEPSNFLPGVV